MHSLYLPHWFKAQVRDARIWAIFIVGGVCVSGSLTQLIGLHRSQAAAQGSALGLSRPAMSSAVYSLFGTSAVLSQTEDIADVGNGISLTGTLAVQDDESRGFAIVRVGALTRLVAVGDEVGTGRLRAVLPDAILIEQAGQLRRVRLPHTYQGYGSLDGTAQTAATAGPPLKDPPVDEIKARVAQAVAPLATVLRAEPLLSDEAYRGLVVNPNGNVYAFEHLGLKPGDSIMAVNGIPLTQDNLSLFADELRVGKPVKVSLMRPGTGMLEVNLNLAGVYVGPRGQ